MKRTLVITIIILFGATLASIAALLFQYVQSPLTVMAIVMLVAVLGVTTGILITTNTRPPWPADPYGDTTADLLRPPLRRDEERRQTPGTIDQRGIVARMSDMLEDEASRRPPGERPAWAIHVAHDDAADAFRDAPEED